MTRSGRTARNSQFQRPLLLEVAVSHEMPVCSPARMLLRRSRRARERSSSFCQRSFGQIRSTRRLALCPVDRFFRLLCFFAWSRPRSWPLRASLLWFPFRVAKQLLTGSETRHRSRELSSRSLETRKGSERGRRPKYRPVMADFGRLWPSEFGQTDFGQR